LAVELGHKSAAHVVFNTQRYFEFAGSAKMVASFLAVAERQVRDADQEMGFAQCCS
jgi:hypothetical protein